MLSLVFSLKAKDFVGVLDEKTNKISKFVTPVSAEMRKKFAGMRITVVSEGRKKEIPAEVEIVRINEYPDDSNTYTTKLGGEVLLTLNVNQLEKVLSVVSLQGFYFRTGDKGQRVLTGKKGYTVESIPRVKVAKSNNVSNKKVTDKDSAVKQTLATTTATTTASVEKEKEEEAPKKELFSLYRLLEILKNVDGKLVKLPTDGYNALTGKGQDIGTDFRDSYIEVAEPNINATESKINLNLLFRKLGTVKVYFNSRNEEVDIPAHIWSAKTVFTNCEDLNMHRLGIVVPSACRDLLRTMLGEQYVQDITTSPVAKSLLRWLDPTKTYAVMELYTKGLQAFSAEEVGRLQLTNREIGETLSHLAEEKSAVKELKGAVKKLKEKLTEMGVVNTAEEVATKVAPQFKKYIESIDDLCDIREAGIDVTTGAYTVVKQKDVNTNEKEIDAKKVDKSKSVIEFKYVGLVKNATESRSLTDALANVEQVLANNDVVAIFTEIDKITEIQKVHEQGVNKYKSALWLNNASSYVAGNYNAIALKESKELKRQETRAANTTAYVCDYYKLSLKYIDLSVK